jgi:hypothetical protein
MSDIAHDHSLVRGRARLPHGPCRRDSAEPISANRLELMSIADGWLVDRRTFPSIDSARSSHVIDERRVTSDALVAMLAFGSAPSIPGNRAGDVGRVQHPGPASLSCNAVFCPESLCPQILTAVVQSWKMFHPEPMRAIRTCAAVAPGSHRGAIASAQLRAYGLARSRYRYLHPA